MPQHLWVLRRAVQREPARRAFITRDEATGFEWRVRHAVLRELTTDNRRGVRKGRVDIAELTVL